MTQPAAARPKVVVFDLGKVLVDFDYRIAAENLAAFSRMNGAEIFDYFIGSPALLLNYETGLIDSRKFFEESKAGIGFRGGFDDFGRTFGNIFSPIAPMIELHARVRAKGLPTYILSNTNELAIEHIRRSFPFFQSFHGYILSYEHRSMKPEPGLYEVVERTTGLKGGDILYLDDRPENIDTAAKRGWQAVLHETPSATIAAVEKSGALD